MTVEQIARVCHEANKGYCESIGDKSQKSWDDAEQWQRDSAVKGVQFRIDYPDGDPSQQHQAWCDSKLNDGWKYGEVKDAELKTHPCLVAYDDLPLEQRLKDKLFQAVVDSLTPREHYH